MEDIYDEIVFQTMESRKVMAIKNILNVVDVCFEPEKRNSRIREKVRKIVLDEINDLYRYFLSEIGRYAESNTNN